MEKESLVILEAYTKMYNKKQINKKQINKKQINKYINEVSNATSEESDFWQGINEISLDLEEDIKKTPLEKITIFSKRTGIPLSEYLDNVIPDDAFDHVLYNIFVGREAKRANIPLTFTPVEKYIDAPKISK